ncbi:hypothetical protein [Parasulfitobacter algicola]|uniref:Uncharacterized protein n=1 Tax=Parasulfitobacter algicola TaxID=2614809 RepID=A0ABX2IPA0_9RHOB|nr:hypothetical protein [Sulfitobacter algicola]NSX54693.1 hypothetical protein [Sulfitobacter algicola]
MTTQTRPLWQRFFFSFPVIGWIARDVSDGDESNIYYALVIFLASWLSAILLFGYPGLIIPALLMVPTMFVVLILISRG